MARVRGQGKLDEFAFVLLAGLILIIIMLLIWGVPSEIQIPTVSPSSKSLAIEKGSSESFLLEINVTSDVVTLTAKGTTAGWIEFSDNNFESSGLSNVEVTVTVPRTAEERDYYGSIEVESKEGGKVTVPLTITVTGISEVPTEAYRTVYIGDFSISFTEGTEVIKTERNVKVKKGMYEDTKKTISGTIERDLSLVTDGSIVLDVFYTNHEGNLVVKLNNQVVFDQKVLPGQLIIPVEKNLLEPYNVIEISTSGPGWKFWSSSVYEIEKVEFSINFYGDLVKQETFEVYRDEIAGFKEGRVEFDVKSYEGDGELTVKINDHFIYEGRNRGHFVRTFHHADVGLVRGQNTISFSTEKDTTYEIEKVKIILVHEEPE